MKHARSSRQRYRDFVHDYKQRRLDESDEEKKLADSATADEDPSALEAERQRRGKRREYLRKYLRWLWPQRSAIGALFVFALLVAGLEMIEPSTAMFQIGLFGELASVSSGLVHARCSNAMPPQNSRFQRFSSTKFPGLFLYGAKNVWAALLSSIRFMRI